MNEKANEVSRSALEQNLCDNVVDAVAALIAKRDEAWSRYAEARADYADETMCGDPRRVTTERNAARDALIAMGVDPELLG